MIQRIIQNIENPIELERLFRSEPAAFQSAFEDVFKERPSDPVLKCWQARFQIQNEKTSNNQTNWKSVVLVAFIAGFLLQLPKWFGWNEDLFYPKFTAIIIFGGLSFLFLNWKQASIKQSIQIGSLFIVCFVYLELVDLYVLNDLKVLLEIFISLFTVFLFGYAFLGKQFNSSSDRINLLKFSGDGLIMSGLLLIGFFLFTALTLGLFKSIHLDAGQYYGQYVVVWLLAPIPFVAAALVFNNNQIVSKISPLIAKIFSPLALLSLLTFLSTYFAIGVNSFKDREFLMLFNGILLAVLALIFFSVSNQAIKPKSFQLVILFLLSLVAIGINLLALTAVLERISMYGFSPNKVAVLGSNVLILLHLLITGFQLGKSVFTEQSIESVEHKMVGFLPIYAIWIALVCVLFPIVF